ncbi:hypothetical protein PIB30_081950 [Stylosanthes scabra]|uniref:Uncharacterized protein n=1 Tax=Stylosanthes scabra TaxID=79078 RepID=A0ABU6VTW9_9FABA|nr:hypothetical protein [Stylosanthes scabra]
MVMHQDRGLTTTISSNNNILFLPCNLMLLKSLLNWRLLFRNFLNQLLHLLTKLKASCKNQELISKIRKLQFETWKSKEEYKAVTLRIGRTIRAETSKKESTEQQVETATPLPRSEKQKEKDETATSMSKVPYPQRLKAEKKDKHISKFLEIFKKLQINIPFS